MEEYDIEWHVERRQPQGECHEALPFPRELPPAVLRPRVADVVHNSFTVPAIEGEMVADVVKRAANQNM